MVAQEIHEQPAPIQVQATTIVYAIMSAIKDRPLIQMTTTPLETINYFHQRIEGDCRRAIKMGWIDGVDWEESFAVTRLNRFFSGPQTKAVFGIMKRRWAESPTIQRTQREKGILNETYFDTALDNLIDHLGGHDIREEENLLTDQYYASLEP